MIKKNIDMKIYICNLIVVLFPILLAFFYCIFQNSTIFNFYLPNSYWNDELIYYKQVEACVKYGLPQGFFGYNESHALYTGFGAWSPVMLLPWILWGKFFGWNYSSPICCNIFIFTLAMVLFAKFINPDLKQSFVLFSLVASSLFIPRYMLSCTPEIICISFVIMFFSFSARLEKDKIENCEIDVKILLAVYSLGIFLTLMRPYFSLLLVIPLYYWYCCIRKKRIIIVGGGIVALSIITSLIINKKFCAPYFFPLLNTTWIHSGIKNIAYIFLDKSRIMFENIMDVLLNRNQFAQYSWGCVFFLLFIWLCIRLIISFTNKERHDTVLYCYWLLYYFAMLLAVYYFYDLNVGYRHFLSFLVIGMLLFSIKERSLIILVLVCALNIFVFWGRPKEAYTYDVPFKTSEMMTEIQMGEKILSSKILIDKDNDPWDNTVIWSLGDSMGVKWQDLYAFPAGCAINICDYNYIVSNFDGLSSKFLMTNIGGEIDNLCCQKGKELIAEYGEVHVWQLRDK